MTLKDAMIEKKISNKELAEQLGVHPTTISSWKRNGKPNSVSLRKLSEFFGKKITFRNGKREEDHHPEVKKPRQKPNDVIELTDGQELVMKIVDLIGTEEALRRLVK